MEEEQQDGNFIEVRNTVSPTGSVISPELFSSGNSDPDKIIHSNSGRQPEPELVPEPAGVTIVSTSLSPTTKSSIPPLSPEDKDDMFSDSQMSTNYPSFESVKLHFFQYDDSAQLETSRSRSGDLIDIASNSDSESISNPQLLKDQHQASDLDSEMTDKDKHPLSSDLGLNSDEEFVSTTSNSESSLESFPASPPGPEISDPVITRKRKMRQVPIFKYLKLKKRMKVRQKQIENIRKQIQLEQLEQPSIAMENDEFEQNVKQKSEILSQCQFRGNLTFQKEKQSGVIAEEIKIPPETPTEREIVYISPSAAPRISPGRGTLENGLIPIAPENKVDRIETWLASLNKLTKEIDKMNPSYEDNNNLHQTTFYQISHPQTDLSEKLRRPNTEMLIEQEAVVVCGNQSVLDEEILAEETDIQRWSQLVNYIDPVIVKATDVGVKANVINPNSYIAQQSGISTGIHKFPLSESGSKVKDSSISIQPKLSVSEKMEDEHHDAKNNSSNASSQQSDLSQSMLVNVPSYFSAKVEKDSSSGSSLPQQLSQLSVQIRITKSKSPVSSALNPIPNVIQEQSSFTLLTATAILDASNEQNLLDITNHVQTDATDSQSTNYSPSFNSQYFQCTQ